MATYRVQRIVVFIADVEADSPQQAEEYFSETEAIRSGALLFNPKNATSLWDDENMPSGPISRGDAVKLVKEDGSLSSRTWRNW